MLGFGTTVLIFMMIIIYGTWIAQSVVEEKSSRVMEVILNAATPFQLLTGKVLGVGAIALTQYAALLATGVIAVLAQETVAGIRPRRERNDRPARGPDDPAPAALRRVRDPGVPRLRDPLRRGRVARQPPGGRQCRGHADNARLDRRIPHRGLRLHRRARRPGGMADGAFPGSARQPVHDAQPVHERRASARPRCCCRSRSLSPASSARSGWPPASTARESFCMGSDPASGRSSAWSGTRPDHDGSSHAWAMPRSGSAPMTRP